MTTERLAALLHEELLNDDSHNPVDEPECRIIAARLVAQGVRVGDDGLRALRDDFESLRTTAREQAILEQGKRIADHFTGQVYAYDEVLRRIETALAAQPAPPALTEASPEAAGLDRERLAWALHTVDDDIQFLRRDTRNFPVLAGRLADAYEADGWEEQG